MLDKYEVVDSNYKQNMRYEKHLKVRSLDQIRKEREDAWKGFKEWSDEREYDKEQELEDERVKHDRDEEVREAIELSSMTC